MKKFIKNNKAISIMILVVIICSVLSCTLLLKYFYFGNGSSKYGTRLEGIKNVEITDNKKEEIKNKAKENKNLKDINIDITGKIIYIRMVFNSESNLTEAKSSAVKLLEEFSEDEKKFYDMSFTLKMDASEKDEGFIIMGAKNVNGTNLVWNNKNSSVK